MPRPLLILESNFRIFPPATLNLGEKAPDRNIYISDWLTRESGTCRLIFIALAF